VRYLKVSHSKTPTATSDEQKIRLGNDAELVSNCGEFIKVKGLEYPIVYLPCAFTPFIEIKGTSALFPTIQQQLCDLPSIQMKAQTERHKEELVRSRKFACVTGHKLASKEACFTRLDGSGEKKKPSKISLVLLRMLILVALAL